MPDLATRRPRDQTSVQLKSPVSKKTQSSEATKTKRSSGRSVSRSPPKPRSWQKNQSSSGSQSSNTSESDSDGSGDSESSRSISTSKTATVDSRKGERCKIGARLHNQKSESLSDVGNKKTDSHMSDELSKKTILEKKATKHTEVNLLQKPDLSNPEPISLAKPATTKQNTSNDGTISSDKGEPASKKQTRDSKNDGQCVEKSAKRRALSPSVLPLFTRILVEKLTRNINKAHVTEIFSVWGKVLSVDMPPDRLHPEFSRSYAYVTYETPSSAADAVNYMNGGQIDGEVVRVTEVLSRSSLLMRGECRESSEEQTRERGRELNKREADRVDAGARTSKSEDLTQTRHTVESDRLRDRGRPCNESERRKERREYEKDQDRERQRNRDRSRERDRIREHHRRARRGSSGSPFANRSGPSAMRQRSPGGPRYRRPSPPPTRPDTHRGRSRSPLAKLSSKQTDDHKMPSTRRDRKASSRTSSSTSDSDSSNSSTSSSRSGSSTSSSSSSSGSHS